ncbi:hypothetical protein S23_66750 [Bradyrhizobium cosmicum]|uniref:Uncharacterized protein n=1 Tax=Bradyrhizobium cosmicum TaxID=1404864 RepID=A0AAI8QEW6_9BRAD|nr:hypothetical protein S23_66750 [Bradyrhizobium cosmicum]
MRGGTASQVSREAGFVEGAGFASPRLRGEAGAKRRVRGSLRESNCRRPRGGSPAPQPSPRKRGEGEHHSDIGLSEMSQSLPVKVEMKSVFIGV